MQKKKHTPRRFIKSIKIDKETGTALNDFHNDDCQRRDKYSSSISFPIIAANKIDLAIPREILKDPDIQTLEIFTKLGIPFSMAHKKRRFIKSKILKTKYSFDFEKLGLYFRFADVFADIKEDKINDFINQLYQSSVIKNTTKIIKIKTPSDGVCIKSIFQNSKELFFLIDKLHSYPFVSNVHFSEQIKVIGDNTLHIILNILETDSKKPTVKS